MWKKFLQRHEQAFCFFVHAEGIMFNNCLRPTFGKNHSSLQVDLMAKH